MKGIRRQITTSLTRVVGHNESNSALGADSNGNSAYPGSALIRNPTGGQTVYLGGPDVNTTTAGFPLASGEDLELDLITDILYGVTATTSQYVYILRRGD